MTYKLKYTQKSYRQWNKLDSTIKDQLKKKLKERLENPRVQKDKLSVYKDIYKIKLRGSDFRLVYEVKDEEIVVLVLTVGKRENNIVYKDLENRVK